MNIFCPATAPGLNFPVNGFSSQMTAGAATAGAPAPAPAPAPDPAPAADKSVARMNFCEGFFTSMTKQSCF